MELIKNSYETRVIKGQDNIYIVDTTKKVKEGDIIISAGRITEFEPSGVTSQIKFPSVTVTLPKDETVVATSDPALTCIGIKPISTAFKKEYKGSIANQKVHVRYRGKTFKCSYKPELTNIIYAAGGKTLKDIENTIMTFGAEFKIPLEDIEDWISTNL